MQVSHSLDIQNFRMLERQLRKVRFIYLLNFINSLKYSRDNHSLV